MKIRIDDELELRQFQRNLAHLFFETVQANPAPSYDFCAKMQIKYNSLEKVELRLEDAIANKFELDGTPDFFIFYQNQIAGVFEFHPISQEDQIEVGFWLFPQYRGLRILSRVFPSMIEYATKYFPNRKIVATTAVENESSQKLMSRAGFSMTGKTQEIDPTTGEIENQFCFELSVKRFFPLHCIRR